MSRHAFDRLLTFLVVGLVVGLAGYIWFVPAGLPGSEPRSPQQAASRSGEGLEVTQDSGLVPQASALPPTGGSTIGDRPGHSGEPAPAPSVGGTSGSPPSASSPRQGGLQSGSDSSAASARRLPGAGPTIAAQGGVAQGRVAALSHPRGYRVQVGAFRHKENADDLVRQLAGHGFTGTIVRDDLYRVWVGGPLDRDGAEKLATELQDAGFETFLRRP